MGLIATLAYRVIIILNFFDPLWVKIAWYIGTIGFIIYFFYEYRSEKREAQLVKKYKLKRIVEESYQEGAAKEALLNLLESAAGSKSHWNAAVIFALSVLALIIGIILDFTQLLPQ